MISLIYDIPAINISCYLKIHSPIKVISLICCSVTHIFNHLVYRLHKLWQLWPLIWFIAFMHVTYIPYIYVHVDSFTVSLHNPNGRQMPAIKFVHGYCQWPLINIGNSYQSCYPFGLEQSKPKFAQPITKTWCAAIQLEAISHTPLAVLMPPGLDCVAVYYCSCGLHVDEIS